MRNDGKDQYFENKKQITAPFLILRYVAFGWLSEDTKGKQSQHI